MSGASRAQYSKTFEECALHASGFHRIMTFMTTCHRGFYTVWLVWLMNLVVLPSSAQWAHQESSSPAPTGQMLHDEKNENDENLRKNDAKRPGKNWTVNQKHIDCWITETSEKKKHKQNKPTNPTIWETMKWLWGRQGRQRRRAVQPGPLASSAGLQSTTRTITVNIATSLTDFLNYFKSEEKWRNRRPPKNFFQNRCKWRLQDTFSSHSGHEECQAFCLQSWKVMFSSQWWMPSTWHVRNVNVSSLANFQARQSRRNGRIRTWRVISASFQRMTGCSISFFLTGGWWVTENCWGCLTRGKCKRHNMGKNMHGSYDVECTICTMYKYGKKYMERSGCMIRACFLRFESHYPDLSGRWARWAILDSKLAKIIHRTKKCIISKIRNLKKTNTYIRIQVP